ncbi:MAG: hypothetical protein ACYDCO_04300 [Armatimonadota bacterium]
MRYVSLCLFTVIAFGLLLPQLFSAAPAPRQIILDSRSSSALAAKTYPVTNLRIELKINYRTPGVILDTVGINGAPVGSFSCAVDTAGKVSFQVYDPGRKSEVRIANGWHVLTSKSIVKAGTTFTARIEVRPTGYQFWLNNTLERTVALTTPLSGQPVYIGDFPGDDQWGSKYNIHPAMTGTVTLITLGPIAASSSASPLSPPSPPSDKGTPQPVATDNAQTINAGVQVIENAFRASQLDTIMQLTIPTRREAYRKMFTAHRAELPRVATLLKTRKLVATNGASAEFQVTEGGRVFSIFFERTDGKWCLASL